MKMTFTVIILVLFSSKTFSLDEGIVHSVPIASEINKAVSPLKVSCNFEAGPIQEGDLIQCYQSHPFFLDALMLITDSDFNDQEKMNDRRITIQPLVLQNKVSVRSCLSKIIRFAKEQNDEANYSYVIHRMSDIQYLLGAEK